MQTIKVAKDFSPFPGGAFEEDGPFSAEAFLHLLVPALKEGVVALHLDGTAGYASSFLEAAFSDLPIATGLTRSQVVNRLVLFSTDPSLSMEIWSYVDRGSVPKARRA